MKKIFSIIIIIVFAISLSSCSKTNLKSNIKNITTSLDKVTEVLVNVSVLDNNVLVYSDEITTSIDGTITHKTKKLNNKFELEEQTTVVNKEISKNDLFNLNLKNEFIVDYQANKTGFECKIKKDNFENVFGNSLFNSSSDVTMKFSYNKKLIDTIECSYLTATNKVVTITNVYSYQGGK